MTYLRSGPADARIHLILAHGAGEGPTSPFLTHLALALGAGGIRVTRFAFPYMAARDGGHIGVAGAFPDLAARDGGHIGVAGAFPDLAARDGGHIGVAGAFPDLAARDGGHIGVAGAFPDLAARDGGHIGVARALPDVTTGAPRRPPDRQQVLLDAWKQAITASQRPCMPPVLDALPGAVPDAPCMPPVLDVLPGAVPDAPCMPPVLGGKSMGGRMASLIADQTGAAGLVCLGYPFHPPGRPERLRTEHLADLRTPTLICQGERDPFGRPDEVARYDLSPSIRLAWIPDGDHSFKPRKRSGRTWEANLDLAAAEVLGFLNGL